MSLIVPAPSSGRMAAKATDPNVRSEHSTATDGQPFSEELIRARGLPEGRPGSLVAPKVEIAQSDATAPERLDPLGAALRAQLGGEVEAATTEELPATGIPAAGPGSDHDVPTELRQ